MHRQAKTRFSCSRRPNHIDAQPCYTLVPYSLGSTPTVVVYSSKSHPSTCQYRSWFLLHCEEVHYSCATIPLSQDTPVNGECTIRLEKTFAGHTWRVASSVQSRNAWVVPRQVVKIVLRDAFSYFRHSDNTSFLQWTIAVRCRRSKKITIHRRDGVSLSKSSEGHSHV